MTPLLAIVGLGIAAAIVFWPQILNWAQESLFPWLERNFPNLLPTVKQAFVAIDNVVVQIRNTVKAHWARLRKWLLKQTMQLHKTTSNKWIKSITSWAIKLLEDNNTVPVKVETQEEISWEELPEEVREEFLRTGRTLHNVDVIEARDRELHSMKY